LMPNTPLITWLEHSYGALPRGLSFTGVALQVLLLSLIPGFEGRYALIYGVAMGLPLSYAFIVASLGAAIIALALPLSFVLLDRVLESMGKMRHPLPRVIHHLYVRYVQGARRRARRYVDRYGYLGLAIFVAMPLPATGIWTGAAAAYIMGMERRRTAAALLAGGLLSNTVTATLLALGLTGLG